MRSWIPHLALFAGLLLCGAAIAIHWYILDGIARRFLCAGMVEYRHEGVLLAPGEVPLWRVLVSDWPVEKGNGILFLVPQDSDDVVGKLRALDITVRVDSPPVPGTTEPVTRMVYNERFRTNRPVDGGYWGGVDPMKVPLAEIDVFEGASLMVAAGCGDESAVGEAVRGAFLLEGENDGDLLERGEFLDEVSCVLASLEAVGVCALLVAVCSRGRKDRLALVRRGRAEV